ncbi:MAG: metallopeptidase TldD-related protein [Kofleriaceae bacterium]
MAAHERPRARAPENGVINRRELIRALLRRNVADWVVIERVQELAVIDEATRARRRETRTRITTILHHDSPRGRGSATISVVAGDGSANTLVEQAVALALVATGQAWKSVPPAAPAQVEVIDPKLAKDLDEAAAGVLRAVHRPNVQATVSVMREQIAVQAKSGFHDDWPASEFRVDALVSTTDRSLEVVRQHRRADALDLDRAIAEATTDLASYANAGAPTGGTCNLALTTDALLHGHGLGVWSVFATQADSELERQGLTRYRIGAPIAPGSGDLHEPLTISSDGSLDFALRSAPIGEDGDAVRRFALVDRGIAVGVGLDMREAALRKRDPNGGVRNLVVGVGTWDGKPVGPRTVEVRRLRALSIDPFTGDASLELALAFDHRDGQSVPFTGGTVRLDLVSTLARARRSAADVKRGAYVGPAAVMIEGVELIA